MDTPAVSWALSTLQHLGYALRNATPEVVLQTAWSCVYRFDTAQGCFYLKQVPPGIAQEPEVINLLHNHFGASVPVIIADNPQEHCFLMQDAGIPLREYFKQGFDAQLILSAVHDYIALQRKSVAHLERFLALGASDWQVANITDSYTLLLGRKDLLIADGLTDAEIEKLVALTPELTQLCEELSQCNIPDTFSHNDFHDNNLLIDAKTRKITMVDLGEVAVTHPFFSLHNMLYLVKERYALTDDAYTRLQQEALQPWREYTATDQVLRALSIIQQCWSVHRALTEYRLITSVEPQSVPQLLGRGRFFRNLRVWLANGK